MAVNHLQNRDAQRKVLTVSFGYQGVVGHLAWSRFDGANVCGYTALGEGEWNRCVGAFYKGEEIAPADYDFQPGALATAMDSGAQKVNQFFPGDVPHSRTAAIGYRIPAGLAETDTAKTPPVNFKGLFETKKCQNFNAAGAQTDFSYSTNPAREIVELLRTYARLPNLPNNYASAAAYWLTRFDWGNWVDFRAFHDQTELVDYSSIPGADGFGLSAEYYSGVAFNTLVQKFVHSNFNIDYNAQPPGVNVTAGNFSAKFKGKIRFPKAEQYTIYVTFDDGARVWINGNQLLDQWTDDGVGPTGVSPISFTANSPNQLADILIHWNNGLGGGWFKLEWESASTPRQFIPSKYLYPEAKQEKLYEVHIDFETPIPPGAAIRQILFQSNSLMQDVNGKIRLFAYEQLAPAFALDNNNIDGFNYRRRDLLKVDPITELEAEFNDLDSQYLQKPAVPVSLALDTFNRKTIENVKILNLYNTTRWRARKVLDLQGKLDAPNGLLADCKTKMAKTYPVVAGSLITAQHRKIGNAARTFLVREAIEGGARENADKQKGDIEAHDFVLQEWS